MDEKPSPEISVARSDLKKVIFLLVGVIAVAYPFVVFVGLDRLGVSNLVLVLLAVVFLRFILTKGYRDRSQLLLFVVVGAFCGGVYALKSEALLKLYPVLMSLSIATLFGLSLLQRESIIEKFAHRMGKDISHREKQYTRRLTGVWTAVLVLNAAVAGYTSCCMELKYWAYYNGFLSYVLFAILFVVELLYRYIFIIRKEAREAS